VTYGTIEISAISLPDWYGQIRQGTALVLPVCCRAEPDEIEDEQDDNG
jgi:hypothetical protein